MSLRAFKYIVISVLILLLPTLAHASKRVALVIGNSQYTNAGVLTNPVNDATDVAEALRKLNFTVLLGTDTDYVGMRKLLQDFSREVADADVATFYYAGHGMSVGGENYLLPVDAELASKTDLDFQALSLSLVQRQMEQSASTRLIFLDACRNNPLTRSWTSASRSAANKGLSSPTGRTKGTYIAFATEPGNVALDGDGTRNSPFSAAFLKHITSPGLELASLMKRVRRDVTITTNDKQVPWSNSGLIGDFYFNPAEPKAEITPDPIPEPKSNNDELALWNEVKDSGDADLINHFVAKFPDSIYAGLAEVKLQKLAVLITPKDVTKTQEVLSPEKDETRLDSNPIREMAYLYEANAAGSGAIRVKATVVWKLKKYKKPEESRAETYIYGKMEIPERDIAIDIQISSNLNEDLSASHLIDIKFDLPEGFKGQSVESVVRFNMKSTEEADGEALIAVPVEVEAGHFLIALGNTPQAVKFNTQLLMSEAWIDIPINFENGKRALLAIEKGETGDQIFKEAFADWAKLFK